MPWRNRLIAGALCHCAFDCRLEVTLLYRTEPDHLIFLFLRDVLIWGTVRCVDAKRIMSLHPLAGQPAPIELLIDVRRLEQDYYNRKPDTANPVQLVSFGTSGHRGTPLNGTFTEAHILAITQAICDYRRTKGINGPLFMGKDTHAVSAPAQCTALEVLATNEVITVIQRDNGFTPTPAISRAIGVWNQGGNDGIADGIIITPSHNPPADGGIKYNPPSGGPADTDVTTWIQNRANELLRNGNRDVKRIPYKRALKQSTTDQTDFAANYVRDLGSVIDMEAIRVSGVKVGVDPLGGASIHYWEPIRERYGLNLTVVNKEVDPMFSFMALDRDGQIRMDCSSPYAMASLVKLKDQFDVAFGNDPDADRHGIVTHGGGLMNPNFYLAVAIRYLLTHRPQWPRTAAIGKTLVSSDIIDRVVKDLGRSLLEVPVGFKWFAQGLFDRTLCFGGEESAGASFLCRDGSVWTTDKDGIVLGLLAAEIAARTGVDPWHQFEEITAKLGKPYYSRIDAPANPETKKMLNSAKPESITVKELAGERILATFNHLPATGAPFGGLKVRTQNGWFVARASGTENIVKIYGESFKSETHLAQILEDARNISTHLSGITTPGVVSATDAL